jgi:FKBP-type peptidyl-prolyl cis-trans isomerase
MKRLKLLIGIGLILLLFVGCDKSSKYKEQEKALIQNYINSLGDTAYILQPNGLYYIELRASSGNSPVESDTISFWYTGMFLDRTVFDSNISETNPFYAIVGNGGMIPGLEEGVKYLKLGGKGRLLLPSSLAYGRAGFSYNDGMGHYYQVIPGYSPLIYEIELASIRSGSK